MADPYPLGGTIYDIAGSAVADDTTIVLVIDVTQSTANNRAFISSTTDPNDGSWSVDLANLVDEDGDAVAYADGDHLQIISYTANKSYSAGIRHTVDVSNPPGSLDIYLHSGPPHLKDVRFLGGFASNKHTSATHFSIYDILNDSLVARIDVPTKTTVAMPASVIGVEIKGGMCVVYDGDGTNIYTSFVRSVK